MARAKTFIRETYGLEQNPFPASAIAQWGSSDERENGPLYDVDVVPKEYAEANEKFVVGAVDSGRKFHFLWSLGEGDEARGFGKTVLLGHIAREINHDLGYRLLTENEFEKDEASENRILAGMGTFNKVDVTGLAAVSLEQVRYLAQVDPATGKVVPVGTSGEFCTRGYSVMLGYWNNPEATAGAIDEARWMHTGDLATMDAEGYVNIVGLIKDMIIRGGENVYPRAVENALAEHPDVADNAVIGVEDEDYGQRLVAFVVLQPHADVHEASVREFLKDRVSRFEQPRDIKIVQEIPRNPAGKVVRKDLTT